MPHNPDINHINDGSGISQTLIENEVWLHRSCKLAYCELKLNCAKDQANKRKVEYDSTDCPSPVKTRTKYKLKLQHLLLKTQFVCV